MVKKTKRKLQKKKSGAWFVRVRGSYLPASPEGWWTYLPFVGYLILTLIAGVRYTSSAAIAVLFIVPCWAAAAVIMTFVAARKSK